MNTVRVVAVSFVVGWSLLLQTLASSAQDGPNFTITPASGPCDAEIRLTLFGFEPNVDVPIDLGRPFSDDTLGVIVTIATDGDGAGAATVTLGALGCEAARLDAELTRPELQKLLVFFAGADFQARSIIARAEYAYTTTEVADGTTPVPPGSAAPGGPATAFPSTGADSGGSSDSTDTRPWIAIGGLAALAALGGGAALVLRRRGRA